MRAPKQSIIMGRTVSNRRIDNPATNIEINSRIHGLIVAIVIRRRIALDFPVNSGRSFKRAMLYARSEIDVEETR